MGENNGKVIKLRTDISENCNEAVDGKDAKVVNLRKRQIDKMIDDLAYIVKKDDNP